MLNIKRFIKFAFGGTLAFCLEWALTILLVEIFFVNPNKAYFVSLVFGFLFIYFFHKTYTFKIKHKKIIRFHKFLVVVAIYNILNWLGVFVFSSVISYIIVIPLVNIIVSTITYPLNRDWVFVEEAIIEEKRKVYPIICD